MPGLGLTGSTCGLVVGRACLWVGHAYGLGMLIGCLIGGTSPSAGPWAPINTEINIFNQQP